MSVKAAFYLLGLSLYEFSFMISANKTLVISLYFLFLILVLSELYLNKINSISQKITIFINKALNFVSNHQLRRLKKQSATLKNSFPFTFVPLQCRSNKILFKNENFNHICFLYFCLSILCFDFKHYHQSQQCIYSWQ